VTATGGPVPEYSTWTLTPGPRENLPVNCVTWFEAFAFCVWDGGRLPTEAEWEFAAANGPSGDLFPWGEDLPTQELAVYCTQAVDVCDQPSSLLVAAVGSQPRGANVWGHRDLAGNIDEWTLDAWGPYPQSAVTNYADVSSDGLRIGRGGSFSEGPSFLRAASRGASAATVVNPDSGLRCARSP
jgi:formylglycine-generating enzyme required for sulfatase activity